MPWRAGVFLLLFAVAASMVHAQLPFDIPKAAVTLTPAALFATQCGLCHVAMHDVAPHYGPDLAGIFLRKPGTVPEFPYSPGFTQAEFVWDDTHLDAWLTNPQKLIPGTVMKYRQADPKIRGIIIAWLKEQH
jgi:cytochrome c